MTKRSRKIKRSRVDPVAKLGIATPEQIRNGCFELYDVQHWTEDDQRKTLRSGERQTIRRTHKLATLPIRKLLTDRELAACIWYHNAHALRYDTTGITVLWGGTGGGGCYNFDHMPKTKEQQDAYVNFEFARAGINRFLLGMFEQVVLHGRPLGRLRSSFKLAARQLLEQIEGTVEL